MMSPRGWRAAAGGNIWVSARGASTLVSCNPPAPAGERHVGQVAASGDRPEVTGVIDEQVEAAQPADGRGQRVPVSGVGDVAGHG